MSSSSASSFRSHSSSAHSSGRHSSSAQVNVLQKTPQKRKRAEDDDADNAAEQQQIAAEMRQQLLAVVPTMEAELDSLNRRQLLALYHLFKSRNVFLSGVAGTGKTHTTKTIVKFLLAIGMKVALTATTGLAAANLEDSTIDIVPKTLHSFAGIGLGEESAEELIKKLKTTHTFVATAARNRWRDTNVLIVDEVSMMSPVFFAKLDKIARALRNQPSVPFGGMTLLLVGDFHQLEPVMKGAEKTEANALGADYCFQTPLWCDTIDVEVMLNQVYRQQDEQFVTMLQEVREGRATARTIHRLHQRTDIQLRFDLDAIAQMHFSGGKYRELSALARVRYAAWSSGKGPESPAIDEESKKEEAEASGEEPKIEKEGEEEQGEGKGEGGEKGEEEEQEQVDWTRYDIYARSVARALPYDETEAMIRLLPESLIDSAHRVYVSDVLPTRLMAVNRKVEEENLWQLNAIHDTVTRYESRLSLNLSPQHTLHGRAYNEFNEYFKKNVLAPQQLCLKIGAQVMLLANIRPPALVNGRRGVVVAFRTMQEQKDIDGVEVDVTTSHFSRRGKDGQKKQCTRTRRTGPLRDLTQKEIEELDATPFPVVKFDNGVEARIEPYLWTRQKRFDKKQVKAQYLQVPIILAYAISIHKSQGMTISSLQVDLDEVFASGQTYVALSRATNLNGLVLSNFDGSYVNGTRQAPNQSVINYYNAIEEKQHDFFKL